MRFLIAAALAVTVSATAGPALANGLEASHISLPSGPASIEGMGRNFAPSLASGTASYGIDIAVPPSAGGFAPHLGLDYDSGGGESDLGMGWKLSGIPTVRRRTENGLPRFDATDAFEVTGMGIPCDLLEIASGTFRPEFESGAFVRVQRSADGWQARDKSGTTYNFGGGGFVEAEGANVVTWLLRESIDLHGHRIEYAWDTRGGHGRLTSVTWNDYGADVRNLVSFTYEPRPDPHTLFSSGIEQTLSDRLVAIDVRHGGTLVRRYELAYTSGIHSQLATVDLVGRDGTSRLPRLALSYTEPSLAADPSQVVAMSTPPGRSPADPNVELSDLDGDGLPDLLVTQTTGYRSYLNSDGKSWRPGVDWDAAQSPSVVLGTTGVQLADLDGDGAIDLVVKSGTSDFRYFPGNTATSFGQPVSIATVPNFTFEDPDTKLADMDGDRRIDVVITTEAGVAIGYNVDGVDWTVPSTIGIVDPHQPLRFSDGGQTQLCDMNGDRVEDLCYLTPGSLVYWLGRGRGVFEPARVAMGIPQWDPSSPWELHDLDGDGWLDIAHVGVNQVDYALATAMGAYGTVRSIDGTPTKNPTTTVRWADMNASGTTDIVWIDVSGTPDAAWQYLDLFPQGRAGLLRQIDNGIGRVTRIQYGPAALDAAAARNSGTPWTSRMNVGMLVVKRVEADDSLGDPVLATTYDYASGTWSPVERTFAGFAGGTETDLGDAYTPTLVTQTTYDVGIADRTQRGLVLTDERRDASGVVFDDVATTYTATTLEAAANGRAVHYTYKTAEQTTHVEGARAPRVTLVEYEQDVYGNVTATRNWGEVVGGNKTAGSDEAITARTYANDTQDWILGRVVTEELDDAKGARIRGSRRYYDGLPLGQLARGDLTREEAWVGPTPDAFELVGTTRYDTYGNVLETTDARGGGHVFTWDAKDHATLLTESVKLDGGKTLTEAAQTDRGFGEFTSVTGYNGQTTALAYDPFGRLLAVARPGDTLDSPTISFAYDERAPLSRVTTDKRVWSGQSAMEHGEVVVDGFGRKRASLTQDEGGKWILSDVGLLDARGNVRRSLRARFATQAERAAPPLAADGPGVDSWRDALARAVRSRTQLGIETRTAFEPLVTKTWDGAQTDSSSPYEHTPHITTVDGLGRTVANTWTLGGTPLSATFTYDAAGDLLTKTDPESNVSRYLYDGRGRRTMVDDPDTGKHSFVFDATGNATEHHKPDGNVLRATFDLAGRPLTDDWNGDGSPEVTRDYDRGGPLYAGLLSAVHDPSGGATYEYDERQRVTATRLAIGDGSYDVASAYDDQDREYLHVYPDKSSIRIQRSARGMIAGYGKAVTMAYDADGVETQRSFNTGVTEANGYDDDRRRTETRAAAPSGPIVQHLKWTLDGASNILAISDLRSGVDPGKDRSEKYVYDNLYRLTTATGTWGKTSWTYSPSGNLLGRASSEATQDMGAYTYGGAGPHAPVGVKGRSIRYDAVGRMLDDGERTYAWDGADNLVRVTKPNGASVDSAFDAAGMRRQKIERDTSGGTHTTRFVDAWSEIDDGQLVRFIVHGGQRIVKLAPDNGVPAAHGGAVASSNSESEDPPAARRLGALFARVPAALLAVVLFFVLAVRYRRPLMRLGPPSFALGALAFACNASEPAPPSTLDGTVHVLTDADELLFADAIGSLTETTSGTGKAKSAFASFPGGLTRYDTAGETRKYANTPRDGAVGLDQMGARSYAPDLGIWTSADSWAATSPTAFVADRVGTRNPFSYASQNPVSRGDPGGHFDGSLVDFARQVIELAEDHPAETAAVVVAAPAAAPAAAGLSAAAIGLGVLAVVAVGVPAAVLVMTADNTQPTNPVAPAPAMSADADPPPEPEPAPCADGANAANRLPPTERVEPTITTATAPPDAAATTKPVAAPTRAYNRLREYGRTPTKADRKALGAGPDQVVDHNPPLVKRYYEGDPATGEKPGYQMTQAEREASAADRSRMQLQPRADSNKQGGQMRAYAAEQNKQHGL